jgi:SAM-dependent methyltransferase
MTMPSTSSFPRHSGSHWRTYWRRDLFSRSLIRHLGGLTPGLSVDWTQMQAVLDVGCGTGAWAVLLARRCPHLEIVGLDSDAAALEMARTQTFTDTLTSVRFLQQDVRTVNECSAFPDYNAPRKSALRHLLCRMSLLETLSLLVSASRADHDVSACR